MPKPKQNKTKQNASSGYALNCFRSPCFARHIRRCRVTKFLFAYFALPSPSQIVTVVAVAVAVAAIACAYILA